MRTLLMGVATKRRATRLRSSLAAAALTALIASGCGGSSSLSHGQLVTRLDAACRQANQAAARLPAPAHSYSALNSYARSLSPIVQRLIGKLTALTPGAADRHSLQSYVGVLRAGDHGLSLLAGASSPAQVTQARSLLSLPSLAGLAGTLGTPACAAAPS